jgi:hypothetical protein
MCRIRTYDLWVTRRSDTVSAVSPRPTRSSVRTGRPPHGVRTDYIASHGFQARPDIRRDRPRDQTRPRLSGDQSHVTGRMTARSPAADSAEARGRPSSERIPTSPRRRQAPASTQWACSVRSGSHQGTDPVFAKVGGDDATITSAGPAPWFPAGSVRGGVERGGPSARRGGIGRPSRRCAAVLVGSSPPASGPRDQPRRLTGLQRPLRPDRATHRRVPRLAPPRLVITGGTGTGETTPAVQMLLVLLPSRVSA